MEHFLALVFGHDKLSRQCNGDFPPKQPPKFGSQQKRVPKNSSITDTAREKILQKQIPTVISVQFWRWYMEVSLTFPSLKHAATSLQQTNYNQKDFAPTTKHNNFTTTTETINLNLKLSI